MLVLCFAMLQALSVGASQTTSYTKTLDDDNNLVRTQDAYLPDRTITNLGLSTPSDIYVEENGYMYIADTDNSRVLIYDLNTETVVKEIGRDICEGITTPKGVFVDTEGNRIPAHVP